MQDQHPMPTNAPWAFFAIAFGFSWLVWLPGIGALNGALPSLVPAGRWCRWGRSGRWWRRWR